jgi:ABC-type branched-subunit amino acid transport system permease subunit
MGFDSLIQTGFSALANGALYAFIALGFSLVNRSTGIINFAQGDLTMLGGILVAVMTTSGVPLWVAVPAAAIACAAASGLFYQMAIRPARRAAMSQLTIMTIGLSILVRGCVVTFWGSDPMTVPAFSGDTPLRLGKLSMLPQELWLIGALIVTLIATSLFFHRTMIGLALRASAANPLGASYMGIDPARLGLVAFMLAGLLGGLGGAIWSPIFFAQVDLGIGLGLKGFTAAVIGGMSSTWGPIVGGVALALLEAFSGGTISSAWQGAILYGLMLAVLLVRPQGLLGKRQSAGSDIAPATASDRVRRTTLSWAEVGTLAAGIAVLMLAGPFLGETLLTSFIFVGIMAIVVLGLVLITGFGGQLALGQGAFMMIGAYASGYLTVVHGWPPLAAIAVGMLLSTLVALALGRFIFRLHGYYFSMASLGVLMIALTVAREWTPVTGGSNGLPGIAPLSIGGFAFVSDLANYELVAVCAGLVGFLALSVARSSVGRTLLAVRSSESAARACGINVVWLKTQVFAFSAAAASLAGSLYVHYLGIANPQPFGVEATIAQVTALTVGGHLLLTGAYVGSAVVVALPLAITWAIGAVDTQSVAGLQNVVFGVLLIALIVLQTARRPRLSRRLTPWSRLLRRNRAPC